MEEWKVSWFYHVVSKIFEKKIGGVKLVFNVTFYRERIEKHKFKIYLHCNANIFCLVVKYQRPLVVKESM